MPFGIERRPWVMHTAEINRLRQTKQPRRRGVMRRVLVRLATVFAGTYALFLLAIPLWSFAWDLQPPSLPPRGKAVAIDAATTLNVLEQGHGPPVVLVHGSPGSGYESARLMDELAKQGRRAIAYDRVGWGYSARRRDDGLGYSIEANARDLLGLLAKLDVKEVSLVGWSYGGAIAMEAAATGASRIGRVVLISSIGPEQQEPAPWIVRSLLASPSQIWLHSAPPAMDALASGLTGIAAGDGAAPPWWVKLTAANLAAPGTLCTLATEARRPGHAQLRIEAIERPVLMIHARGDPLVPFVASERLHARSHQRSTLTPVAADSHMLVVTHPKLVADEIVEFEGRF